jgi:hypothetical protein
VLNDPTTRREKVENAKKWSNNHDFLWTLREIKSRIDRL